MFSSCLPCGDTSNGVCPSHHSHHRCSVGGAPPLHASVIYDTLQCCSVEPSHHSHHTTGLVWESDYPLYGSGVNCSLCGGVQFSVIQSISGQCCTIMFDAVQFCGLYSSVWSSSVLCLALY